LSKDTVDECFLGGMLHDMGKLLMAVNCPGEYDRCLEAAGTDGHPVAEIESEVFGVTHADAGMYLLRLWGLPETVTAAVALHHRPAQSAERRLGAVPIVHAANALARNPEAQSPAGIDEAYLAAIVAPTRLEEWRMLARGVTDGAV
jgi:HD-like signal output (HDOD) protein